MIDMKEIILQVAKQFMQVLDGKSKITLVFDDDPDGICAAALMSHYLKSKNIEVTGVSLERTPILSDQFRKKVLETGTVLFVDICLFNSCNIEKFTKWCTEHTVTCITFDHHISKHKKETDVYPGLYINTGDLQQTINPSKYCSSKIVFDVLLAIDPMIKDLAWMAAIGILGDYAHDTWKKIIQFAITQENNKLENNENEYHIPSTKEELRGSIFGKASDLIYFGIAKGDSLVIYQNLAKTKTFKEANSALQQYKSIGEEVTDYVENLKYMVQHTPKKNSDALQIFEVEVKSQFNILVPAMNHMSEAQPDILIIGYSTKGDTTKLLCRLENKKLDLPDIFKKAAKEHHLIKTGGSAVGAGATMPKELFKTFKNDLYEVLETYG